MIYSNAEIDVLKLSAWCKDLPADTENLPRAATILLQKQGLIRTSRSGWSLRTAPAGYTLLQKAGFSYLPDKQYLGKSGALLRRIRSAELACFFWRYGADVFQTVPPAKRDAARFLPSFALRRKSGVNVLGGTRLMGFYYTGAQTFVPYYLTPESGGICANAERRTFQAESLACGGQPVVLYTGAGDLPDILSVLFSKDARREKNTADSYLDALEKFGCPAAVLPLNEDGMRQLRIIETPDYRQRILRVMLGPDFAPPESRFADGKNRKTGEPFFVGIGCDVHRMLYTIRNSQKRTHIILLSGQLPAVQKILRGQNAVLHPAEAELAEEILALPHALPTPDHAPFQTEKGEYLYAPPAG